MLAALIELLFEGYLSRTTETTVGILDFLQDVEDAGALKSLFKCDCHISTPFQEVH